jgi:cysteine desulfuration protein SufE
MTPQEHITTLIETFELYEDWADKYEYIIELGKQLPPMPEALKTEHSLIKGCQSKVWLVAQKQEGKIHFLADSDTIIAKGIIALLLYVFNDQPPETIKTISLDFIETIGLSEHLSPNRNNGLRSMIKTIQQVA